MPAIMIGISLANAGQGGGGFDSTLAYSFTYNGEAFTFGGVAFTYGAP